jgi:hypothetical protein
MDEQLETLVQETGVDDELAAMAAVAKALDPLSGPVRARVISWAAGRFGAPAMAPAVRGAAVSRKGEPAAVAEQTTDSGEYATFAELFDRLSPRNDDERILAAMYWLQVVQHQATMKSLDMTRILTDLGHRVDRIRDVLPRLQRGKPARVLQVSHGRGPKGRRVVKLSNAAITSIEAALNAGGFENAG